MSTEKTFAEQFRRHLSTREGQNLIYEAYNVVNDERTQQSHREASAYSQGYQDGCDARASAES